MLSFAEDAFVWVSWARIAGGQAMLNQKKETTNHALHLFIFSLTPHIVLLKIGTLTV
jgi:hypothetical protein